MVAADADPSLFHQRVRPILTSRCLACHGEEAAEGGLRLDGRDVALKGGRHGPAIVPGNPEDSYLLKAVRHSIPKLAMPPKERLSAREVADIERWIKEGALWPGSAPPVSGQLPTRVGDAWTDENNPIVRLFGGARLHLWSFRPVATIEPPAVTNVAWVRQPIDRFILSRLEKHAVPPAESANRRSLIRRVSYDLTGLPPTPDAVAAFQMDERPDAYERLVDELLASPRFGEHWARMWLDVVRYSDSNGFDWDEYRPLAWRYRDYVIRSFNTDKPFDQFIIEQLAGDELVDGPPRNIAEQDSLIATGFLRLGPQDNAASLFNEQARSRAEWLHDLVETTGSAFLGLTLSCCRCHDHKHDPISQVDYYRLRAFFEPITQLDERPINLAAEQDAIRQHNHALDAEEAQLHEAKKARLTAIKNRLAAERAQVIGAKKDQLPKSRSSVDSNLQTKKNQSPAPRDSALTDAEVAQNLSDDDRKAIANWDKRLKLLKEKRRTLQFALSARSDMSQVKPTYLLYQGDHREPREAVTPGYLSAFDPNQVDFCVTARSHVEARRLTLARWIASPSHPLTARVAVNRIWQQLFGQGVVENANDFGLGGSPPTHPELLDWLAAEFVRQQWSVKRMIWMMVTSSTYRQASSPAINSLPSGINERHLYHRHHLRRLSAEQLRDSLLFISGTLTDKESGVPVWPELPSEILQANPAFLDDNPQKTKGWYPSPVTEQGARSIFVIQKRTVKVPFLETFDLPDNACSCARRDSSTLPTQALTLLNSPLAARVTQQFAARVCNETEDNAGARINRAFSVALQRSPSPSERNDAIRLVERHGIEALCRVLLNLNELVYID